MSYKVSEEGFSSRVWVNSREADLREWADLHGEGCGDLK